jgi:hypothetical protein
MKFLALRAKLLFVLGCLASTVAAGALEAQTKPAAGGTTTTSTQNVNVVNTPTVNVGTMPAVSISGTPAVNVNSLPAVNVNSLPPVSLAGTPAVSINGTPTVSVSTLPAVSLAGTPNVNIAGSSAILAVQDVAGSLTNVGRLPSQQVMLFFDLKSCPSAWLAVTSSGNSSCFDMANEAGKVLVITDIFWSALGTAGTTCFATVGETVWSAAQVGPDGWATKDEHHTTGAMMTVNPQLISFGCNLRNALLHGYLLPNQ